MLGRSLLWVASVRLALWTLPYRVVRRIVPEGLPRHPKRFPDRANRKLKTRQVARCIRAAAGCVPHASCLTQALSGQALLHQHGIATRLHIGVARSPVDHAFKAHAWLECDHEVILGGDVMGEFTAFEQLPATH